jgi:hypothetical protein
MTIQGRITDMTTGEALPGVNLALVLLSSGFAGGFIEIPTGEGTTTDSDGRYSLTIPSGQQLNVSYVGYITQKFGPSSPELKPSPMVTDIKLVPAHYAVPEATAIGKRTYWRELALGSAILGLIIAAIIYTRK